jgi:hypothetical protein
MIRDRLDYRSDNSVARLPLFIALACVFILASSLRAQAFDDGPTRDPLANYDPSQPPSTTEFTLGIGYSNISLGDGEFDSENALHIDPSLSFSPLAKLPQLRLGVGVPFSLVLDNSSRTIISRDGTLIVTGSSDIPLWLLEPEIKLSWRQYFGEKRTFFIEPGVTAGGTFAFLSIDADGSSTGESFDESASAWSARAFLRAGGRADGGFAGIEASYLRSGNIDLADNADGQLEEWYIGIFGSIAFCWVDSTQKFRLRSQRRTCA